MINSIYSKEYPYEYPEDLDLRPGSKLHDDLVRLILEHAQESYNAISARFDSWNKIDRTLTAYVPADDEEKRIKEKDPRKPVSIVFPYSYAVLETLLTYLTMAFVQDPIFQYIGTSPEDVLGAIKLEKLIQTHVMKNKVPLALHTQWRDALAYGFGIAVPGWEVHRGKKLVKRQEGWMDRLGRLVGRSPEEEAQPQILFEGNSLTNVSPYQALPDPSVSPHNIQKGSFFGWIERENLSALLTEEYDNEDVFNTQYLKALRHETKSQFGDKHDKRQERFGGSYESQNWKVSPQVDTIYMQINLVPSDYGLGDSEYPEKWFFALSADKIIRECRPLNLNHGKFPVSSCAPDYDGYSSTPISRLETMYGLQETIDWMFGSHVTNVRKALNDMLIVDPFLLNMKDLQNPEPGKLVRVRKPAWGRGVDGAVKQLTVQDVTARNMSDVNLIINWMGNIAGADESMMGALRQGGPERLTRAEYQGTRSNQTSRLEHIALLISMQSMQDIGYFFASHAQQFLSQSSYVAATGRWEEVLNKEYESEIKTGRMKVSPFDINIDYDLEIRDGSIPGSNYSDVWMKMFEVVSSDPELRQEFDIVEIFKYIARNNGAKNPNQFTRMTLAHDEAVLGEVEKGNLVPMEGAA